MFDPGWGRLFDSLVFVCLFTIRAGVSVWHADQNLGTNDVFVGNLGRSSASTRGEMSIDQILYPFDDPPDGDRVTAP